MEKEIFEKVNTFLHNHTGEQYFEIDATHFIEKYPDSKLIPIIKNAMEYQKAQLDERICAEMLMHSPCIDCIWERRGYYVNAEGFVKPLSSQVNIEELSQIEKDLLDFNLGVKKPDYNTMQKFVYEFKLPIQDNKGATYVVALLDKQKEISEKAAFIEEKKRLEEEEQARLQAEAEEQARIAALNADKANSENNGDNTGIPGSSEGFDDKTDNTNNTGSDPVNSEDQKKSEDQEGNTQE
jgi:hypothetical protein